jgi:carbamoyl-phosphate synthase small subunit
VVDPRIGNLGPALLALEDGSVFPGVAFGAAVSAGGDLVVNTSQTGYQEVCTDPSYAGQVVVMTYPLIGNYGRLLDEDQSIRPWLRALVVANATAAVLDGARQLAALLRDAAIPAIAGVDTRALARHLRTHGSLRGIVTAPGETDVEAATSAARRVPRWEDQDFVGQVSPPEVTEYPGVGEGGPRIGIVDLGLKANIVRAMRHRGASVRVFPHDVEPSDVLSSDIDGVIPLLGICLGHQIVARAAGADTQRLRFGHHGANHPVQDLELGLVQVTAQNHEVQVVGESLPSASGFRVSQVNLNDRSVEGLRHRELAIETVQYHPEGAPGPLDALAVFDRFVAAAAGRP